MADLLLSNRRPFQSEDLCGHLHCHMMWVKFVHHLYYILYQMKAKCQSPRHTFSAPDQRFVSEKGHQQQTN
jgi:hypothetical protein